EIDREEDHMAAGIARGPGMLRDAQNLIRCRARALREDKEGLVPDAPGDGQNRQQPGAAVEEEDERDGRGRHVRSAWPAGPPEEGKWGGEWAEVQGLDRFRDRVVERDVGRRPHQDRETGYRRSACRTDHQ